MEKDPLEMAIVNLGDGVSTPNYIRAQTFALVAIAQELRLLRTDVLNDIVIALGGVELELRGLDLTVSVERF